jgi:hypothetical protein
MANAFSILARLATFVVRCVVCLRVAACLGAWLAIPDLSGDLGGFARELAGLNCPICL